MQPISQNVLLMVYSHSQWIHEGGGMFDDLLTLRAAAEQFNVNYDRLRRAAWDGRLPTTGTGHARLVHPDHVMQFLQIGRVITTEPVLRRDHEARLGKVV